MSGAVAKKETMKKSSPLFTIRTKNSIYEGINSDKKLFNFNFLRENILLLIRPWNKNLNKLSFKEKLQGKLFTCGVMPCGTTIGLLSCRVCTLNY